MGELPDTTGTFHLDLQLEGVCEEDLYLIMDFITRYVCTLQGAVGGGYERVKAEVADVEPSQAG